METGGKEFPGSRDGEPSEVGGGGPSTIGVSPLLRKVVRTADEVASNDCTVLIEGESGTGKELLARRIHGRSPRRNGPFVPVSCPGVTDSLFESQFYGHIRGAFTGATTDSLGVVRAAENGTLLLDEIGELSMHLQPKLLRLLQEREVVPVGASRPITVNTRFIAATNRNLAQQVARGEFRTDLYHRLNVVRLEMPALRDRPEDVNPLLDYYLQYFADRYNTNPRSIPRAVRNELMAYHWPGNVRELCCYVERLYAANLPAAAPAMNRQYEDDSRQYEPVVSGSTDRKMSFSLAAAEARAIRRALETAGYNRSQAAKLLHIHRSTLLRKMRYHGLDTGV
ncbi:MAG: sigma-54 interaction domain-containing protein [Phycisphaerae bacterium]